MNPIKSIAVGVDFTAGSAAALREALRIAQWNRAVVHGVHVIDALVAAELEEALSAYPGNVRDALISDAKQAWADLCANIDSSSAIPIEVRIDSRIRGILAAAQDAKADLLVVGAGGTKDTDQGLGAVATSCVRHSMISVLVVRDTQPGPFKSIVACVDFSPTSLLALDEAARMAAQDGAALHVLHVFEAPWHQLHYRAPTPEVDPQFQHQYRAGLERRLHGFASELGREIGYLKPTFTLFDWQGHRSGIVEYAGSVGADLIVLGTRGRTSLRDVLLGSTAEKALRDSMCSVLAIKPEASLDLFASGESQSFPQMRLPG